MLVWGGGPVWSKIPVSGLMRDSRRSRVQNSFPYEIPARPINRLLLWKLNYLAKILPIEEL